MISPIIEQPDHLLHHYLTKCAIVNILPGKFVLHLLFPAQLSEFFHIVILQLLAYLLQLLALFPPLLLPLKLFLPLSLSSLRLLHPHQLL